MALPTLQNALLAQHSRWVRMGDRFQGRATFDWTDVAIWGGIGVAFLVALYVFSRYNARNETPKPCRSPNRLFLELCKLHGLDRASRSVLKRLAESHGIPHAASIFLQPDRFETARLPASVRSDAETIERLRAALFGPSDAVAQR